MTLLNGWITINHGSWHTSEFGMNGHTDKFQLFRLAKNQVIQVDDHFFSPYSEKIADYGED